MKLITTLRIAAISLLIYIQISAVTAQGDNEWHANIKTVEKLSEEGRGFNYREDRVPAFTLPDLFTSNDGVKITSGDLWTKIRRPEIL